MRCGEVMRRLSIFTAKKDLGIGGGNIVGEVVQ
jgi:hypothetical protein